MTETILTFEQALAVVLAHAREASGPHGLNTRDTETPALLDAVGQVLAQAVVGGGGARCGPRLGGLRATTHHSTGLRGTDTRCELRTSDSHCGSSGSCARARRGAVLNLARVTRSRS
jgi:hypothetical protein